MSSRFLRTACCFATAATVALAPRTFGAGERSFARADSLLRLPRIFGDGMVLQRDQRIPVWGWVRPGARVDVALGAATRHAVAGRDGRWLVVLPPMRAGGPVTLTVRSEGSRVTLHDVLVGDVWIASGQSNMELEVARAANAPEEIRTAHDSAIRQFKVPIAWGWTRGEDLTGGSWAPADSAHVARFTAVGYFFARELRRSEHVPIGLINDSWGGSAIEAWLSPRDNGLTAQAYDSLRRREDQRVERTRESLRARLGELPVTDAGMPNGVARWADPALADSGWSRIPVPGYWEAHGYADLDGVAWYRRTFDLSSDEQRAGAALRLPAVDDDDVTWVNGVQVGHTMGYAVPRSYAIPRSALRTGRNVLTVRVTDAGGGGGINGVPSLILGGITRSLAGDWRFRVGKVAILPDAQQVNKLPAVAFNRMVDPILPFGVKGVIWYQGESNANDARQARAYREQFATLVKSWRRDFTAGPPALPFLWVQLPNFGRPDSTPPSAPAWALQRESMEAALALPNTGQAITIDVGEEGDIHPRNKQDVGTRLARVALATVYHRQVPASGPRFRSATARGDTMVVAFDDVGSGLTTHAADRRRVGAFALAGADHGFVWASARIVGGGVVQVWSDQVHAPVAVRYAWSNAPSGPLLYNREGLPAAPFRSDRW
jgi:sialate O-acetylesterase